MNTPDPTLIGLLERHWSDVAGFWKAVLILVAVRVLLAPLGRARS